MLGGEAGFSWHFQMLVVGERGRGSHGSPNRWSRTWEVGVVDGRGGVSHGSSGRWLWRGSRWFSFQSQPLVVGGEAEVLMAVPDASCGEERWRFS